MTKLFYSLFVIICFHLFTNTLNAQSVGIGTPSPNSSAALDITNTNKGLLIPRVVLASTTDISTIPSPATGLLIYNTNAALVGGTGFYYNAGTPTTANWTKLTTGTGGSGGSGWNLTGNAATDSINNFIGTTDNKPVMFRVNNQRYGMIGTLGSVSLGRGANATTQKTDNIIAIGDSALNKLTTGKHLVAIGNHALQKNDTAKFNTAIGSFSLAATTTGEENVGIGDFTLFKNTNGFDNTAVGSTALFSANGAYNTAVGYAALSNSGTATFNTAVGALSMLGNTTGSNNAAFGFFTLNQNNVGSYNTAIGDSAYYAGDFSNSTAIGFKANITASNQVRIGNNFVTSIGGFAPWSNLSDGRYKKNITEDVKGLSFIMKLRPVMYNFNYAKINDEEMSAVSAKNNTPIKEAEAVRHTGFIAQEVEAAANEIGYDFDGIDKPKNAQDKYGLRYSEFVVPLVKAVQEQQLIIQQLQKTIETQNKKMVEFEQRLLTFEIK